MAIGSAYAAIVLILGRRGGLLARRWHWSPLRRLLRQAAPLFVVPAFGEELLFRGLLMPSAIDGVRPLAMLACMALSVGLFVAWHGLTARKADGTGQSQRRDPRFLPQTALLGVACTLVYVVNGSLWPAELLHWLAVLAWRDVDNAINS